LLFADVGTAIGYVLAFSQERKMPIIDGSLDRQAEENQVPKD
jgi:hypothetical protein